METVLVSFIGTGNYIGNESEDASRAGYEQVDYTFDNNLKVKTTIFGSAILKYLTGKGEIVNSWLIMGTPQSIWCDLIQMFDESVAETLRNEGIKKQYKFLSDEAKKDDGNKGVLRSQIKQDHLNEWQKILSAKLNPINVICKEVGDGTKKKSHEQIFKALLDNIEEGNKVVFDVTNGLRNQPIITSFVLMYLRYLRNITDVKFYYGAKDLNGEVFELDFCDQILKATEAVAIYEQTGNYEQIGCQIDSETDFINKIRQLTFDDEMHRATPELPNELKNRLDTSNFEDPVKFSLSERLKDALGWSDDIEYAKRLYRKAIINKEKRQYFKAVAFIYEAIAIASCLVVKTRENNIPLDTGNYLDRKYALNDTNSGITTRLDFSTNGKLSSLKTLRNAILHGTDTNANQIAAAISDEAKFIKVFEGGEMVFEDIIKKIEQQKVNNL